MLSTPGVTGGLLAESHVLWHQSARGGWRGTRGSSHRMNIERFFLIGMIIFVLQKRPLIDLGISVTTQHTTRHTRYTPNTSPDTS